MGSLSQMNPVQWMHGTLVSSCKPNEQKAGTQPPANASRDVSKTQSPLGSAKPEVNILATRSEE
jgi:hypothetical protein